MGSKRNSKSESRAEAGASTRELERERGVRGNEVTEWNAEEARPLARIKGGLGRAQIVSG